MKKCLRIPSFFIEVVKLLDAKLKIIVRLYMFDCTYKIIEH